LGSASLGVSSRLVGPNGEIQAAATSSVSGLAVDLLDDDCPRWEVALHRAKPWRAKARDGSIYRHRYVRDPRSELRSSF
jgi:deaminated glutathione amidase